MSNVLNGAWPPNGPAVPHSYTVFCPPLETSPRIARHFTATVLRSHHLDDLADAVMLCTSELVTNAVVHAAGVGSLLWLAVSWAEVRLTVYDGNTALPRTRPVSEACETGRGLPLLDALATEWGATLGAPLGLGGTEGKGIWCRFDRHPAYGVRGSV
ncbi:ATP-binding protein [Streptomyces gobiensis]|uniref:ATP-binding protein n=1 Tax=Streptomyces gobiensis TaxID=2875706 RepID=UPI001E42CB0A|nr:ATP-binding protein [Streptomyces gobiensis]UGY92254.1 ATP-binding protein [Streptomyces gobiensis]